MFFVGCKLTCKRLLHMCSFNLDKNIVFILRFVVNLNCSCIQE